MEKRDYINYLLSTQKNHTCTHLADHHSELSHDQVTRFLSNSKFTTGELWQLVSPHISDTETSYLIIDDSVQDKRYSHFIDLVKLQYSGNTGGLVKGINLVNMVHSNGVDQEYYPIDYRIYHPDTDGKTKNDHFRAMFKKMLTHKQLKCNTILFDSWYGSVDNLKLIHRSGWTFFTTLKSNRKVSLSKETGYQDLSTIHFTEQQLVTGIQVKLKKYPYQVKLFKLVSKNGDIDWVITNDLSDTMNLFVAENSTEVRWQAEQFHREYKQLTGSEKCQCRKAVSQRNHLACCYHAWLSLKIKAKQLKTTVYQVRQLAFGIFLKQQLANPFINFI